VAFHKFLVFALTPAGSVWQAFGEAMLAFVNDPSLCVSYGIAGRERVKRLFSRQAFAQSLDNTCADLVKHGAPRGMIAKAWLMFAVFISIFVCVPIAVACRFCPW
jgi:hypothetical protein